MDLLSKCIFAFSVLVLATACDSTNDQVNPDMIVFPDESNAARPIIDFADATHDFGSVMEGEAVSHTFSFTNKGKAALVIAQVNTECGCTTAKDWPKDAIMPGETGQISVHFDTDQRPGDQERKITVVANTQPTGTILNLRGNVIGPSN